MGRVAVRGNRPTLELRAVFAANFRRVRQSKSLTQRQIAGVPQKTVSAAELGRVDLRLSTMARMALALGEDVAALLAMPV